MERLLHKRRVSAPVAQILLADINTVLEHDNSTLPALGKKIRGESVRSANQHGHLILETEVLTLNYFKGQYSLLLLYGILEKLVT